MTSSIKFQRTMGLGTMDREVVEEVGIEAVEGEEVDGDVEMGGVDGAGEDVVEEEGVEGGKLQEGVEEPEETSTTREESFVAFLLGF